MADEYERRWSGEIRVDVNASTKLSGYAIVFNAMSLDLGGFKEIILPEAVDRTLSEALDVRALVDHDTGKVIGRTREPARNLEPERAALPEPALDRDVAAVQGDDVLDDRKSEAGPAEIA